MQVQSLGWEDSLEKEMATHSSILTWRILWTEEPGGLQSTGSQRVGHNCTHTLSCGVQALGHGAPVAVAHGLRSCGSQTLKHKLSSCGTQA